MTDHGTGGSRASRRRGRARRLAACLFVAGLPIAASAQSDGSRLGEPRRAVLIELFTSQGCSSCPPADRLLSELGSGARDGVRVIPLAFHVDYWNYIGWTDPFSSAAWSERQRAYALAFGAGRIYTPQLVVDGAAEFVGSDRRQVERAVASAARTPERAVVAVTARRAADGVEVEASGSLESEVERPAGLWIALVRDGLETPVGRGENAGRTLVNDSVVVALELAATLAPGESRTLGLGLDLPETEGPGTLRVAVFVQDPETLAVHGAASTPVD